MMRVGSRSHRAVAVIAGVLLVAAACGDDDEESTGTSTADAPTASTAGTSAETVPEETGTTSAATDDPGAATTAEGSAVSSAGESGSAGCPEIDASIDQVNGTNAGRFMSDLMCADEAPLKAEGDPIVIAMENPEGDPNGSFPEFSLGAQAAVDYINNELGGLGADIQNGKPGRPIQLELCKAAITPDDSQRCANELVSKNPMIAFSTVNFFGNHIPIFNGSGIPMIVIAPITVADYSSPDTYAIAGGGGCVGSFTGMAYFATHQLEGRKIGIPWSDTPPGVVCYYDLTAKPLDVLNGTVEGTSEEAGTMPDLTYLGVPIKPATPDVTPQVAQILDFDPDVIIYSAQGADCWNLVDGLGRNGWAPEEIPLVLGGACIDFEAMKAAGDLAEGVYFIGSAGTVLNDPDTIEDPFARFEAEFYQRKTEEFGMPAEEATKGFGENGWAAMVQLWEMSSILAVGGEELTSESIADAFKNTVDQHSFGSTPLACAEAVAPYTAVCNTDVTVSQWDGTSLKTVEPTLSGAELVAGTEIRTGP